ncbi:MAG: Gfo/Idh/MocA family oxidoreductase [Thaumarchaeota archaeon]|nr:Gfo/Idh/MocA family oxidoreductase [Nitrososphaerota archaeon]
MKILILGCGSIGSRHAKNLRSLGITKLVLCDADESRLKSLGNEVGTKMLYSDYKKAVKENPDILAAVICTPTAFHVQSAVFLAKKKINLFIEKPLSNSLSGTKLLSKIVSHNRLVTMMGHSYMFENGFIKLQSLLKQKIIGKVYFASYLQGQYLPDWHPKADYRVEYSARKELGGGALFTLTSHTFYVVEWLFGRINSIHGSILDTLGPLEVNVDDSVFLLVKTKNDIVVQTINNFIVGLHQHKIIVEGEKGRLEYDFVEKKVKIFLRGKNPKILDVDKGPNDRYVEEMRYFLNRIKHKQKLDYNLDLESGMRFLEMVQRL